MGAMAGRCGLSGRGNPNEGKDGCFYRIRCGCQLQWGQTVPGNQPAQSTLQTGRVTAGGVATPLRHPTN
jgi:hypothetical protein